MFTCKDTYDLLTSFARNNVIDMPLNVCVCVMIKGDFEDAAVDCGG